MASNNNSTQNHLDRSLVQDAVQALLKYERKRQQDKPKATLIDDFAKWIIVQVSLSFLISSILFHNN